MTEAEDFWELPDALALGPSVLAVIEGTEDEDATTTAEGFVVELSTAKGSGFVTAPSHTNVLFPCTICWLRGHWKFAAVD